jgi:hypothetical protein
MELTRVSDQDLQVSYYPIRGRSIRVIRDDYLPHGTKQRGYSYFEQLAKKTSGVATSAAPTGYGQVALAYMAQLTGLKAYIFINYYPNDDRLILWAKSYGAIYIVNQRENLQVQFQDPISGELVKWEDEFRPNSSTIYQADLSAKLFANEIHQELTYVGLGLDDIDYIRELTKSISRASNNLRYFTGVTYPKRLWLAVGSGTILQTMTKVWPFTHFMCVQVGKDITEVLDKLTRVKTTRFVSPLRFDEPLPFEDQPPYDSLESYDAKIWPFVLEFGEDGDFVWNVAGSVKFIPPTSQDWGRRKSKGSRR